MSSLVFKNGSGAPPATLSGVLSERYYDSLNGVWYTYNGGSWNLDGFVYSVAGRTGNVVLGRADITDLIYGQPNIKEMWAIRDDFDRGSVGSWGLSWGTAGTGGGQNAQLDSVPAGRIGVAKLITNATSNYTTGIYLPTAGSSGVRGWMGTQPNSYRGFIVRTPTTAAATVRGWAGQSSQFSNANTGPTDFIGFRNIGGDWFAVCRASGTETVLDSGIAYSTTAYQRLEWLSSLNGSSIQFWMNGVLIGSIANNIPSAYLEEAVYSGTTTTSAVEVDIDAYSAIVFGLTR